MSLDVRCFWKRMHPTEAAIIAAMIVQKVTTMTELELYIWVVVSAALLVLLVVSDSDTQILCALCATMALFAPYLLPFVIIARLCVQLRTHFKAPKLSSELPFETMYPDTPHSPSVCKESAKLSSYSICF